MVSLLYVMEDGSSAEIAVLGNQGVTEAGGRLQAARLIRYSRGHITILDRSGLGALVCECYAVARIDTDRLLPDKAADWCKPMRIARCARCRRPPALIASHWGRGRGRRC